jgi:hypothetical protein
VLVIQLHNVIYFIKCEPKKKEKNQITAVGDIIFIAQHYQHSISAIMLVRDQLYFGNNIFVKNVDNNTIYTTEVCLQNFICLINVLAGLMPR